jgi:hypothetical protein
MEWTDSKVIAVKIVGRTNSHVIHSSLSGLYTLGVQLTANSTLVAQWGDLPKTPLIAVKGRVVTLNAAPYSSAGVGWNNATSNSARLLANLLLFKGVVQPKCNVKFSIILEFTQL